MHLFEGDTEHPSWKQKAKERKILDNYTCTSCGKTDCELHAHHLEYSGQFRWSTDIDKLTSFCSNCHAIVHGKDEVWNRLLADFSTDFFRKILSEIQEKISRNSNYAYHNRKNSVTIPHLNSPSRKKSVYISFAPYIFPGNVKHQRLKMRIGVLDEVAKKKLDLTKSPTEFNTHISEFWFVAEGLNLSKASLLPYTEIVCVSKAIINPEEIIPSTIITSLTNDIYFLFKEFECES
jgi:hypothetical protein